MAALGTATHDYDCGIRGVDSRGWPASAAHDTTGGNAARRGGNPRRDGNTMAGTGHTQRVPCHTFSTSARPSIPVGRKINATIRIEKAATSLYSTLK